MLVEASDKEKVSFEMDYYFDNAFKTILFSLYLFIEEYSYRIMELLIELKNSIERRTMNFFKHHIWR